MHQCCYSPVFFFYSRIMISNGNDRTASIRYEMLETYKCTGCCRSKVATFPTRGNTGRKHGNQDNVDSSRYNQARFLFAFAFKWFHVCYAKCYAEGTRVKSNRCTTQTCIFIQHNGCFVSRIFLSFLLSFSSIFFSIFLFFRSPYFSLRPRELVEHDVLFENLPSWKIVVVGGGWGNSEE